MPIHICGDEINAFLSSLSTLAFVATQVVSMTAHLVSQGFSALVNWVRRSKAVSQ